MSGVLTISPNPVNVPPVRVNQTSVRRAVTLHNAGDAQLQVTGVLLTGPFAVAATFPFTLGPGASAVIDVTSTPPTVGVVAGTLDVLHDAPGSPTSAVLASQGTAATSLSQHNRAEMTAAGLRFFLEATLPVSGDLPHRYVFVARTTNRLDPKADLFQRVANLADLTTLPLGRDAALLSSASQTITYLAATWTFQQSDLVTAVAAKEALEVRLSQLIRDWVTYSDAFRADPVPLVMLLPVSEQEILEAAVDVYRAAKQGRRARQDVLTQNIFARLRADVTLADAEARLLLGQNLYANGVTGDGAGTRTAEMTAAASALSSLIAAGLNYLTASTCAAALDRSVFSANISVAQVSSAAASTGVVNHATYEAAVKTARDDALVARDAAQAADTAALAAERQASDAVAAAVAAEAQALAAVLVLCPNFDASTVCECPG